MKVSPAVIRAATPLTGLSTWAPDPCVCSVCGVRVDPDDLPCTVWREHDERDRPLDGVNALVFLGPGKDHQACSKTLDDHPRLYAEVEARPGHFPGLCGPCTFRDGLSCKHPDLRANGGQGLRVVLDGLHAIVCSRGGGCGVPPKRAQSCDGRTVAT